MALSWNPTGGWWVSKGSSVDVAGNKSVAQCNSRFGGCSLSAAVVAPEAPGCIAVARAGNDRSKLFAGIGETVDAARASVLQQLGNETGQFKFAACNSKT